MADKVDVDGVRASGFGLAESLFPFVSEWHAHGKHQLLYAQAGTLHLEADGRQWLLPPQRAAWIRSGCPHRVGTTGPASLRTLYFADELVPRPGGLAIQACQVFPVTALLREMILYGMQWGPGRDPKDAVATRFFAACADVCAQAALEPLPLWLPTAKSPELGRAMAFTLANLHRKIGQADAARASAMSERTLTRRFQEEAQTTWRDFLHTARLLKAMELLAQRGARVGDVAAKVGWGSVPAFTRAFEKSAGESPKAFRRRNTD